MPNCVCSWALVLRSRVPARVRADVCGLRAGARPPENARQAVGLRHWQTLIGAALLLRTIVSPALTHVLSNRHPDGDRRKLEVRHQAFTGQVI